MKAFGLLISVGHAGHDLAKGSQLVGPDQLLQPSRPPLPEGSFPS
jgi:hypothetical protein